MAYLDALMAQRLDQILAQEKKELVEVEAPEKLDLDAIVVSTAEAVRLLTEATDVLREALLELKQLRLGMSMALQEDLTMVLSEYESITDENK